MSDGSVMVWAAFLFYGKTDIALLFGRHNSEAYCDILKHYLHPLMNVHLWNNQNVLFQQESVSVRTAKLTQK